jgi:serine protease Do
MRSERFFAFLVAVGGLFCLAPVPLQAKSTDRNLAPLQGLSASFQDLVGRVRPAVVQVLVAGYAPVEGDVPGLVATQRGTGSGIILDPDGYIVTNAHVVEATQKVQVLLPADVKGMERNDMALNPHGRTLAAKIVGVDTETDLAVLKIEHKGLPFLELADYYELRQGQLVLAFGNPMGLENSVTMGVVSSVARQIHPEDSMAYIQTDAPINPGNSGGPLVNVDGKVVGINTFILSQSGGSEGLGFAVPSNIIRNVYRQLKKDHHVHRGQIGVEAQTVTPSMAAGLKLPRDWGVILGDVTPDGPADNAGLQVGDMILTLHGQKVENARRFELAVYQCALGEVVTLEVRRGQENTKVNVTVAEKPNDPFRFFDLINQDSNIIRELGIFALDITDKITEMLPPLRQPAGVLIAARVAGSTVAVESFFPGDLIDAINTEPVVNLSGLRAAIGKLHSGDPVVMQIQRSGKLMYVTFEMP